MDIGRSLSLFEQISVGLLIANAFVCYFLPNMTCYYNQERVGQHMYNDDYYIICAAFSTFHVNLASKFFQPFLWVGSSVFYFQRCYLEWSNLSSFGIVAFLIFGSLP